MTYYRTRERGCHCHIPSEVENQGDNTFLISDHSEQGYYPWVPEFDSYSTELRESAVEGD
jgi:hypothetical protein